MFDVNPLYLFCFARRLEQEKGALQKKLKLRGVTADHVVGLRSTEMETEIEELKKNNSELETEILTIKYVSVFKNICYCAKFPKCVYPVYELFCFHDSFAQKSLEFPHVFSTCSPQTISTWNKVG